MKKRIITIKKTAIGDGIPKICVPITGSREKEILERARAAADAGPDLAEWRIDFWEALLEEEKRNSLLSELGEILKEIPLLLTFRSRDEGGNREISREAYRELNLWAARQPEIALVDVEALNPRWEGKTLIRQIRDAGKPVIGSRHYFDRTPEQQELEEIFRDLADSGADILKLAVMPREPEDVLRLMEATLREDRRREQPVVTMAMGKLGAVSRISGGLTGSAVTFGSAGEASAPGQLPAGELKRILGRLSAG